MAVSRRSDKCFKCNQLGHWAKDCPNNSTEERLPKFSLGNEVIPPKLCRCRRQCDIRISKSIANPDRMYYKCDECNFFQWCDVLEAFASQNPNPNTQSRYLNPNDHSRNLNPVLSTPSYNGPNPSPTSPSNNPSLGSPSYNLNHNPSPPARIPITSGYEESGLEQQVEAPSIRCACDAGSCRVLTAHTEKNNGRRFFACHIKKGEGSCGFFKWCDQLDSAAYSVRSEPEDSVRRNDA